VLVVGGLLVVGGGLDVVGGGLDVVGGVVGFELVAGGFVGLLLSVPGALLVGVLSVAGGVDESGTGLSVPPGSTVDVSLGAEVITSVFAPLVFSGGVVPAVFPQADNKNRVQSKIINTDILRMTPHSFHRVLHFHYSTMAE